MSAIKTYLAELNAKLATGQTTEHTHRAALGKLLETLNDNIQAVNEPKHRQDCGAPDYAILTNKTDIATGHVEAKDVGIPLTDVAKTDQLKRYRKHLQNLVLTDYIDFWWYREGDRIQTASLGNFNAAGGKIKSSSAAQKAVADLLSAFLAEDPEPINKAQALAKRLANLTHMIRDIIVEAFRVRKATPTLKDLREALAVQLMPALAEDANTEQFADLFAQTLAYGLFAAACNHHQNNLSGAGEPFTLANAARDIPKTNPLLRRLFAEINHSDFDDEPYASFVKQIVTVLSNTAIGVVLEDFGKSAARQDPILHFYETFLAAYDPKLRESRGVYYTPEPVVGYIVRSVDHLLKTRFKIKQGLADTTQIDAGHIDAPIKQHKTLILDPAVGTGTFLYEVVRHIRDQFQAKNQRGLWNQYVHDHLLPRLHGFELLMAPYAMAHLKLGMQLAGQDMPDLQGDLWRYGFETDDRLRVYLTNTLEEAEKHVQMGLGALQRTIGEEAAQASKIKRDLPILVVLGNPPYSGVSSNNEPWIDGLLKGSIPRKNPQSGKTEYQSTASYYHVDGKPLGERNPKWLQDDYVKFIRWAQWRLEQTGQGVLAFITNHGYLDNPTFRGMRWSLMQAFDEIYILDLHGNAKKKEVCPDGSPDQNVFDIQQGVAIGIFLKTGDQKKKGKSAAVKHFDLWGTRKNKYAVLNSFSLKTTNWSELEPQDPMWLLRPLDRENLGDYTSWQSVTEVLPTNSVGIVTGRDKFTIDFDRQSLQDRVDELLDSSISEEVFKEKYLRSKDKLDIAKAREEIKSVGEQSSIMNELYYRPFDSRWVAYHDAIVERGRKDAMPHMHAGKNLAIITSRMTKGETYRHAQATRQISEVICMSPKTSNNGFLFPLYLYPGVGKADKTPMFAHWPAGKNGRRPNLDPGFVEQLAEEVGLAFVSDGRGDMRAMTGKMPVPPGEGTFGPEDVLAYIYAVFHWPEYRRRFAPMLKLDFPRVPLPSQGLKVAGESKKKSAAADFFRALVPLGHQLLAAHLLEDESIDGSTVAFPESGDGVVAKGYPKYVPPHHNVDADKVVKAGKDKLDADEDKGRVYINPHQYFEGVEHAVWAFQIGGYQVCDKWLKDRRGRSLSFDDLTHYRQVVESLRRTGELMQQIEQAGAA